jgi:23S rRNA maturation mini-RNase III
VCIRRGRNTAVLTSVHQERKQYGSTYKCASGEEAIRQYLQVCIRRGRNTAVLTSVHQERKQYGSTYKCALGEEAIWQYLQLCIRRGSNMAVLASVHHEEDRRHRIKYQMPRRALIIIQLHNTNQENYLFLN